MDEHKRRNSLPRLGDVCLGTKPQCAEKSNKAINHSKNISLLDIHSKYTAAFDKILQRTSGSNDDGGTIQNKTNKAGSTGLTASGIEFFKRALNLGEDLKEDITSTEDGNGEDLEQCLKCTNISRKRSKRRAGSLKNENSSVRSLKSQTNLTLSSVARRYPYYSPRPENQPTKNKGQLSKAGASHSSIVQVNTLPVRLKPLKWKKRRFTMSDFDLQMSRLKVTLAKDDVIIREIDSRNSFAASEIWNHGTSSRQFLKSYFIFNCNLLLFSILCRAQLMSCLQHFRDSSKLTFFYFVYFCHRKSLNIVSTVFLPFVLSLALIQRIANNIWTNSNVQEQIITSLSAVKLM